MVIDIKPELHDLLKLVPGKHDCPHKYETELSNIKSSGLWTALKHHCVPKTENHRKHGLNCNTYPLNRELFCIHYSDILASCISRRLKQIYQSETVFKVWKDSKPCSDMHVDKTSLLGKISTTMDFSNFFKDNEKIFRTRAEDAGVCPFASLYTHSILVKNWYDFLHKHSDYFEIPETIDTQQKFYDLIDAIINTKDIFLCYARIKTDTLLVRLKDTHLLSNCA